MLRKVAEFLTSRVCLVFALIALQAYFFVWLAYTVEAAAAWGRNMAWIASILLALWITQRNENAAYKIGWIIAVLALPILGMSLYLFFRQRPLARHNLERAQLLSEMSRPYLMERSGVEEDLGIISPEAKAQSSFIYQSAGYPLYTHTRTQYYSMGQDFFEALIADLKKAKQYIFMEYFIIKEGYMLDTVLDILQQKAAEGLDVRLMYDDMGCASKVPTRYYEEVRARGIKCEVFNRLEPTLDSRFNNRDHRKITVIDGIISYVSGANLSDEYINVTHPYGTWKDGALRLEGLATRTFLTTFLTAWAFTARTPLELDRFVHADAPDMDDAENGFVQPFSSSPLDRVFLSQRIFLNMITRATKYVYINTPYLDIGDELVTALQLAATSGVDVRLTVPYIPDKKVVFQITQSYFPELIRHGVRIFEYKPGFIHTKSYVCDDEYGFVGTVNMDFRSLYLHWECGVWMYGTSAIAQMKEDYLNTCAISKEIGYAMTQDTTFFTKFARAVLRVFGPLF